MGEATNKIMSESADEPRTTSISADDSDENTEQLRANIEDTRAEMSQTINEIQERLSPDHLMGQVKETVREATIGKVERVMEKVGETLSGVAEPALEAAGRAGTVIKDAGTSVGQKVWRNPIPVAMIGLGVGMLFMRWNRGQGYYESSSRKLPQGRRNDYSRGLVGETRHQTQGTGAGASVTGALNQVKETASDLASRSTDALSNYGTRFQQVMRENPLAVGAVAVAAGTAVGLMLPSTRIESEYIGETGGMLVDKVEDAARGALDQVKDAAKSMTAQ